MLSLRLHPGLQSPTPPATKGTRVAKVDKAMIMVGKVDKAIIMVGKDISKLLSMPNVHHRTQERALPSDLNGQI